MANLLLYLAVVMIWGTTWIVIPFQIGVVPAEVSVAWRFILASAIMFAWVLLRRLPLRVRPRDHLFLALQGVLIFSTNFFLLYLAAQWLTTGIIAVVFSTASVLTMLFNALLHRRLPPGRVALGAVCGAFGVGLIFWPELAGLGLDSEIGAGLLLCVAGTSSFALGGIVTARNRTAGLPVRGGTAWAMAWGALWLSTLALLRGQPFTWDPSVTWLGSLFWLAVVGSVVAFAAYFALLGRIGTDRAAYATVLFPVVALSLSTVFEGYQWTAAAGLGVLLTLAGNLLVLGGPRAVPSGGPAPGARPASGG